MPLSANTVYDNTARLKQLNENWLFEFDNSASGTLRLSFADCYVGGNLYRGMVLGEPSIRSSIDLVKSQLKVSNFSLECANGTIAGVPLSELLLFASTKYINWPVRVYSQLTGNETLANCKQIFTGRLVNVSHGVDTITLDVEEYQPWQYLRVPSVKSPTGSGRYFPVVYGTFTPNDSTPASPDYCPSLALWPGVVDRVASDGLHCLLPQAYASTEVRPHLFEEAANQFVPLVENDLDYLASSTAVTGGYEAIADPQLIHAWKLKPTDHSSHSVFSNPLTDPADSYDDTFTDEATTYASATIDGTAHYIYYSIPQTVLNVYDEVANAVQVSVFVTYYAARASAPYGPINLTAGIGGSTLATFTPSTSPESGTHEFVLDATDLPGGVMPTTIGLEFTGGSVPTPITIRVYDVRLEMHSRTEPGTDAVQKNRAKDQAQDVKALYFGGDGLARSWTTGAATEIHELHRDLLYRFAGYTTEPAGWTALDTARSGWTVRWWADEPVSVLKLLEQAQFEGGFVFAWAPDGTSQYIYVKSSYSSGDVTYTLDERDIAGLKVSHTPFGDMVTKKTILYSKHPATGNFQSVHTYTNSTARTAYNVQSLENIENVELEMLVGSVSDHASHYGRINGTIKCLLDFAVVNPLYWGITVGDILQFTAARMPVKTFATDWTQYFMVTSVQRRKGVLQVSAREVG